MNSSFWRPSLRMICISPCSNAMFEPGLRFSHTSAYLTRSIRLGSPMTILAPFLIAAFTCRDTMGCPSVVFDPKINSTSASLICASELLAAPAPNEVARPATVGACQTRAQLSTLLVCSVVLTNFANR
ncbi:hypothetical protein MBAV_001635 [Candidatus Magnetobacterium bavaricum]|uniref:Uncharacterized protein n=1 Tax=Candidatus Magnetobacterium bavaricum TaxID=29290 RepID=A0A0F3GWD4_9BACT|nr:hypothetical protein MBAV_001635 [Candidatus Magnetobacterium bavaricum]